MYEESDNKKEKNGCKQKKIKFATDRCLILKLSE